MDEKTENKNEKKSKKRGVLILVILLLFLLISGVAFWISNKQEKNSPQTNDISETESTEKIEENEDKNDENADEELVNADVTGNEEEMVSENYRVSQVKFGGIATVIENGKSRDIKPEIYQVKSENIISQEDNEPRILISWKTNKETISSVEYAKSDGKDPVVITEDGYGFEHTMLIKNMEFSTIYTYRIEATDKWGNKINTEYFSAYTGDKSESIFDLITNAVEDVFGWAM